MPCYSSMKCTVRSLRMFKQHKHVFFSLRFARQKSQYTSSWAKCTRSKVLGNSFLISSSLAGFCLYLFMQKKHLCKEANYSYGVGGQFVHPDYEDVVSHCRDLLQRLKDEVGAPGIVVGVSVDGETKWEEGLGYADIENRVSCSRFTVMRIASISKSITMAAVAKLWEEGKLDMDKPVQHYVPDFPKKTFSGEPVEITCRQLVSHLAGIRHYKNKADKETSKLGNDGLKAKHSIPSKNEAKVNEYDLEEYYIKDKFEDTKSALKLFKDDALIAKPGSSFNYTTYGWTLISAIVEKASNEPFTSHMQKLFKKLGMTHTYLDENDNIIYHRSRNYMKDKRGFLTNAPYVNNSYKWAGGGFLSTVSDLLKFANVMLYSLQYKEQNTERNSDKTNPVSKNEVTSSKKTEKSDNSLGSKNENLSSLKQTQNDISSSQLQGYLMPETMKTMWYPITKIKEKDWMYGMGWFVLPNQQDCEYCGFQHFSVAHTGGAIGASSVLLIMPEKCNIKKSVECEHVSPPKGIVVAITTNLKDVSMIKVAYEIASLFGHHSSKTSKT